MDHDPLIRRYFVPNGRPLNWEYASRDPVIGPLSKTILGFSRPTTAAAERLTQELATRGVEIRQVKGQGRLPDSLPPAT